MALRVLHVVRCRWRPVAAAAVLHEISAYIYIVMSKAEFKRGEQGRRPKANADDRLPVKNMASWGCTESVIKEPRYAERAYQLCCPVETEEFSKIKGQVRNIRTPSMLGKARYHKDAFESGDRVQSTPGKDSAPLQRSEERSRPFFTARKKER